jgi:hypothetical protein
MSSEELENQAQALRALQPQATVDRDQLMYAAGRAAASRGWVWPSLAAVATAVAVVLGGLLLWQPEPKVRVQIVYLPANPPLPVPPPQLQPKTEASVPEPEPFIASNWPELPTERLQEMIARYGLDALPMQPPAPRNNLFGKVGSLEVILVIRFLSLSLVLFGVSILWAEDPPQPVKSKPTEGPKIQVVKLVGKPETSTKASQRYRLAPDSLDMKTANAAPLLMRAALVERQVSQRWTPKQETKWLYSELPREEAALQEVRTFLGHYSPMLSLVDQAAHCTYCDWGFPPMTIQTIPDLPLGEIQAMRQVAGFLALRYRLQVHDNKLDEALQTLCTGLALARHVGNSDFLIQDLVGVAIATIFLGKVEEFIQLPGAPNLYWALTQLPTPLVDCRRSIRQEMNTFARSFPQLRKLTRGPMSVEQVNQIADQMIAGLRAVSGDQGASDPYWSGRLGVATLSIKLFPEAKKALLDQGLTAEQIQAMPSLQVVLLYLQEQYEEFKEDILKWLALPPWQGRAGFELASRRNYKILREKNPLLALLLPAIEKVYQAQFRVDWRVAGLRTAEALRLYASSHQSLPPAKLSDITEVPLPINPYTGHDFSDAYQVKDGVGVLELIALYPRIDSFSRRFELAPTKP